MCFFHANKMFDIEIIHNKNQHINEKLIFYQILLTN